VYFCDWTSPYGTGVTTEAGLTSFHLLSPPMCQGDNRSTARLFLSLFTLSVLLDLSHPSSDQAVTPRIPWGRRRGGGGASELP
jgi:hypothetical protein